MVLLIENQTCPSSLSVDRLVEYRDLITRSTELATSEECRQPQEEIPRTIYVAQREFAVLARNDHHGFHLLGSDQATTCHLLILDNQVAVAMAHLDGHETKESIEHICQALEQYAPENTNYDLYLAGGFVDPSSRQYSRTLSNEVLKIFTQMPRRSFHLQLAAITMYNDRLVNGVHFPMIYGLCFDVLTKSIRKMEFTDYGPAFRLRAVYHSTDSHPSYCIYSSIRGYIILKRFQIERDVVERYFRRLHKYCFSDTQRLLSLTSTSPEQERPGYTDEMRKTILYVLKYHEQLSQWFDPQTKTIVYEHFDQKWKTNNPHVVEDIKLN